MIYDELRYYMTNASSPQQVMLLDRAHSLLSQLDDEESFMDGYDAVCGEFEEMGDETVVDQVMVFTDQLITHALTAHSITMADHATLRDKIDVLQGLMDLQHWGDRAELDAIVQMGESSMEKLCGLLALVSFTQTERYLAVIHSFNPSLLQRIKDELLRLVEEELVDPSTYERNVTEFKRVKAAFGQGSAFERMLSFPATINQPFQMYFDIWSTQARDQALAKMNDEAGLKEFAVEWLYMSSLSEEGLAAAPQLFSQRAEAVTTDLDLIGRLIKTLNNTLMELSREQA